MRVAEACRKTVNKKKPCASRLPRFFLMERAMGIEPTLLAWKAKVLPLNYARIYNGRDDTI